MLSMGPPAERSLAASAERWRQRSGPGLPKPTRSPRYGTTSRNGTAADVAIPTSPERSPLSLLFALGDRPALSSKALAVRSAVVSNRVEAVSYTHLTLPT